MLILSDFQDLCKLFQKNLEKSRNIESIPILNIHYSLLDLFFHRFVVKKDKDHY